MDEAATTAQALDGVGEALRRARASRQPIAPLTDQGHSLTLADAYAIARWGVAADVTDGARIVGHKIGLTATAVQRQLGVDEPDYGTLLDTMALDAGRPVRASAYIAPRIELELAFRLRTALRGPGVTVEQVRAATESVHPAIELVDSRIADWRITLADTVADNASSGAFLLAGDGFALDDLDVTAVEVALHRDGELIEQGRSDAVLGDPCAAVAWLANAVGRFGDSLAAGEIVLSGACTRMTSISPGQRYHAVYTGLGELDLEVAE